WRSLLRLPRPRRRRLLRACDASFGADDQLRCASLDTLRCSPGLRPVKIGILKLDFATHSSVADEKEIGLADGMRAEVREGAAAIVLRDEPPGLRQLVLRACEA